MNTELLLKVRDRILAEPEHFVMEVFYESTGCGAAACIGGWAVHLAERKPLVSLALEYYTPGVYRFYDDARHALQLNAGQADRLFFVRYWPEKAQRKYEQTFGRARAQVAADRIDHFVKTEGRE